MRFKEFLAEYAGGTDLDTACRRIKQQCKYFLKESKGLALYRGIRGISDEAGVVFSPAPKNRPAKDSSDGFNLMFNSGFDLAFDYPTIRSSCMYATGSFTSAKIYGPTYFVFPKGDFSFTYSLEYEDSYEDSHKMFSSLGFYIEDKLGVRIPASNLNDMFEQLAQAVGPAEFMHGSQKVVDSLNTSIEDNLDKEDIAQMKSVDIHQVLLDGLKKMFKEEYEDSKDLRRAIAMKHEIGFYEFEGYFAVPTLLVYQTLKLDKSELGDRFADEIPEAKYDPSTLYPYLLNIIDQS